MNTLKQLLAIQFLVAVLVSCQSNILNLFDAVSIQLPTGLAGDLVDENRFVNSENGVSVDFSMSREHSFGNLLPKIDFDFLYNHNYDSTGIVRHKEIKEISGLKIGIVEIVTTGTEQKEFFTEINNEILMCRVSGDTLYHEYINKTFDGILNSLRKN